MLKKTESHQFDYYTSSEISDFDDNEQKLYLNGILVGSGTDMHEVAGLNNFTSTLVVLISVCIIGGSCYLLVLATENISHILGINLFFGAFIIAAIASSIPDTIFSVQDAKNDKFIDSFSNAYGSNIFDICIGIGLPVLVYSLIYGPINMNMPIERIGWIGDYVLGGNLFMWSLLILFFFTALVSLVYYKRNLTLKSAVLIFLLYLSFIITLLIF